MKTFGNRKQEVVLLEHILAQCRLYNLPYLYTTISLQYLQIDKEISQSYDSQKQKKKGNKSENEMLQILGKINELHNFESLKTVNIEMKNYHYYLKPLLHIVRAMQFLNLGQKVMAQFLLSTLLTHFKDSLPRLEILNALFEIVEYISHDDQETCLEIIKHIDLVLSQDPSTPDQGDFR